MAGAITEGLFTIPRSQGKIFRGKAENENTMPFRVILRRWEMVVILN
jgi:hypothetical protein